MTKSSPDKRSLPAWLTDYLKIDEANPFSLESFRATLFGAAALRAIDDHMSEIFEAADVGGPPLNVVIPILKATGIEDEEVVESFQWRMVDRQIRDRLGPAFVRNGSKKCEGSIPTKGSCYKRSQEP